LKGTKENAFETIETIETIDSDRRRTSRNRVSSSARRVAPERALGKKKSGSPRLPAVGRSHWSLRVTPSRDDEARAGAP
jgi:hypothetical protein